MFIVAATIGAFSGHILAELSVSAGSTFQVGLPQQTPYQSTRLALTYARLLPEKPEVLKAISAHTHMSEAEVHERLSMVALRGTAVLVAKLSAPTLATAVDGMTALGSALRLGTDSAGSRLTSTVTQLSPPAGTASQFSPKHALVLGAILALIICFVIVVAIERRIPRIDELCDLAELVPFPVARISWPYGRPFAGRRDAVSGDGIGFELIPIGVGGRKSTEMIAKMAIDCRVVTFVSSATEFGAGTDESMHRALAVMRGAPVRKVEEALRAGVTAGRPITAALLVSRRWFAFRLKGSGGGTDSG